jgi:hypothetical protein
LETGPLRDHVAQGACSFDRVNALAYQPIALRRSALTTARQSSLLAANFARAASNSCSTVSRDFAFPKSAHARVGAATFSAPGVVSDPTARRGLLAARRQPLIPQTRRCATTNLAPPRESLTQQASVNFLRNLE